MTSQRHQLSPTRRAGPVDDVPFGSSEREMLLGFLQRQRDLVRWKLEGLSDRDASRVETTSGMTIPGIVDHLTDVERSWIRRWFAGRRGLHIGGVDADHSSRPEGLYDARLQDLLTSYAEESRRCDEIIAAHDLSDTAANSERTLRWILHHLIEETSRHLGHLDLLRELADGQTGAGYADP